jgi:phospholipid-binding lipoprotein MlaA
MRSMIGLRASACLVSLALLASPAGADDPPAQDPSVVEAPQGAAAAAAAPEPLDDELYEDDELLAPPVHDPLEPSNRAIFHFNDRVDQYVIAPLTRAYRAVVPGPLRACVRRVFRNLKAPVYIANNLLQLRFRDAAETAAGFALNTTAGWAGLFDPGSEVGWEAHPTDFGQTLGLYGARSGPYLVVPLMGPTTLRDGIGEVVDRAFDPLTYLLGMSDLIFIGGSAGFITREANDEKLAALRESAVDYYAAMRSAYTQSRESRIATLRQESWLVSRFLQTPRAGE